MNILLAPMGSAGDVHPFVALGAALKSRGHRVTLITSGIFESLAKQQHFQFVAVMTPEEHAELTSDPELWHPRRGLVTFVERIVLLGMRRIFEQVTARNVPGETVVLAPPWAIGARVAQEVHGIPLATVHVAPLLFRSAYKNRRFPRFATPDWVPPIVKRGIFALGDLYLDRKFGRQIVQFRSEFGLSPARRLFTEWWNSPELILGLFPEWFAPPQPDWPAQTRLCGFPLYGSQKTLPIPEGFDEFLAADEPPLAFTCGFDDAYQADFFVTSIEVCQRLGRRGILFTQHEDQLPKTLPPHIRHYRYVDFGYFMSKLAAIVHHGGIGTSAQALEAGIPQLVRPITFDQPDNARRLTRLGVALELTPKAYRVEAASKAIDRLLHCPEVKAQTKRCAEYLRKSRPLDAACEAIEQLAAPVGYGPNQVATASSRSQGLKRFHVHRRPSR